MPVSASLFEQVRVRANQACEYCGVSETDARGLLTVDHYRPRIHGGTDDVSNLVYACVRCNQHKADYWPVKGTDTSLWNPREEHASEHFFDPADGRLLALTDVGRETIRRLRLNRPQLVNARLKQYEEQARAEVIARIVEVSVKLAKVQIARGDLGEEAFALLLEQQKILGRFTS